MTGRPASAAAACPRGENGQAAVLLVGVLCALLAGAFALGALARGIGTRGAAQRAADLAALAGAQAMRDAYPRLFDATGAGIAKHAYLALGRDAARRTARLNGAGRVTVGFPDGDTIAPVRIRVTVSERFAVGGEPRRPSAGAELRAPAATDLRAVAVAELSPAGAEGLPAHGAGGGYDGPLAYRQGKPMRPDVALAFDRMAAAARRDGHALIVTSGHRSDAEQAALWARNPDPRWVAPPGRSLHRNGTELDLGPPSAYGWLAANTERFHFVRRYPWEPWHYGYVLNARSAPRPDAAAGAAGTARGATGGPRGAGGSPGGGGPRGAGGSPGGGANRADGAQGGLSALPAFVPARFEAPLARAAQRYNVSATLLAAQIHAESAFNPFAVSPAGARGIAQFMPGTARAYGLADPFDAPSAIDAQARMMRDLLRRFSSVPLALAAYNAGPARVAACVCIPPIPETRGYVARILGLMGGAGEAAPALAVRLVR